MEVQLLSLIICRNQSPVVKINIDCPDLGRKINSLKRIALPIEYQNSPFLGIRDSVSVQDKKTIIIGFYRECITWKNRSKFHLFFPLLD